MSMVENPEAEPGSVIEVFQKGYTVNGRLARPARVIVARRSRWPRANRTRLESAAALPPNLVRRIRPGAD